jgi:glycerol-3-phosphate dehydrogenase
LKREPHVNAAAAIYSPRSGIVDAERLVTALFRSCEAAGVMFLPASRLVAADPGADGVGLHTERESMIAGQVVNAAGLYADHVSALLGGETFQIFPCRGEYAELTPARRHLVNGLVYPLPDATGHSLGLHLLPTTHGEVWLGPTVHYQDQRDDYENGRLPVEAFVGPARRLLPEIKPDDLRLGPSGIRAKLQSPSGVFVDFLIRRDARNPRVVQAAGIDSPGLTSCLAVGRLVSEIVADGLR